MQFLNRTGFSISRIGAADMEDEEKIYIAMHDEGHEYPKDSIGSVIGAFDTRDEAAACLMLTGFSETDKYGNFWKGRDRAWIHETSFD